MGSVQSSARLGRTQVIQVTGTTATAPLGVTTGVNQIRLAANTHCHVSVVDSSATAATTADPFLPANWEMYATVTKGQFVSSILGSSSGGVNIELNGSLWVTEVT